jgi:regulatory protein YycH of two-component signal transduction system YycFG
MKIDIKTVLPYLVLIGTMIMTWGMWSERLNAVEEKADSVTQMQQDIAVIKAQLKSMDDKMSWMEEFLIKNYKEY